MFSIDRNRSHRVEGKERESVQLKPNQAETKRNLEDYLDPVLLSTISAKIGHDRRQVTKKKKIIEKADPITDFDWPVHQLEPLYEIWKRDSDAIRAGEDDEGKCCTPFGRFEQAVLKRFEG